MKLPFHLLFAPLLLIQIAQFGHAQDARKGPYADLIEGEFAHAETPLANNALPLWLIADRKISHGKEKYQLLICLPAAD